MKIKIKALKQEKDHTCLPACIRTVLNYYHAEFSELEIATKCKTKASGTRIPDAIGTIESFNFPVSYLEDSTLDDIFESIIRKQPVIVFLGVEHLPYGDFGSHAVVVIGFEDDQIIFIDPAPGREIRLNLLDFFKAWQSRGNKAIIIHPYD